ncbi:MAG: CHAT domain-containing protein [Candidatus Helarchaeota archaeon]
MQNELVELLNLGMRAFKDENYSQALQFFTKILDLLKKLNSPELIKLCQQIIIILGQLSEEKKQRFSYERYNIHEKMKKNLNVKIDEFQNNIYEFLRESEPSLIKEEPGSIPGEVEISHPDLPTPTAPTTTIPVKPSAPPAPEVSAPHYEKKKFVEREKITEKKPVKKEEVEPRKIKRFGDIVSPMEMTVKKEYFVNVGVRVFKEDVTGMPVPMEITVPEAGPPIIEVFVIGRDFKVDQPRRSLIIPLDADSDILNFRVTPKRDGLKNLTVEFYQEGTIIGRAILKIIVKKKKEPVNESLSSTAITVASQFHETRLDATLRIIRYGEDFFFSLFTPRAKAVVSQKALFGKSTINLSILNKLQSSMEDAIFDRNNPRAALDRLRELGAQIYNFIPKQIRKTIKSIGPKYLMIETGDLLVPWELAYDGEDFLCIKYCLGKRVFDETRDFRPPPFCIGKKILNVIFVGASPEGVPEISVKDELELFDVYNQTKRIILSKLIEPDAVKRKVLESLNKGDLIHLTCHGKFEEADPMESALLLSDDILTAKEIDQLEISNWPLIFANACSTGAISKKVVGIGGIARSFLEAGAIAFLGPLFEIPDDIAVEFTKEFYNNLLYNDENLGEAILNTRKRLRDQFGGAFWATFSLYGDPTLSLCKA